MVGAIDSLLFLLISLQIMMVEVVKDIFYNPRTSKEALTPRQRIRNVADKDSPMGLWDYSCI